MAKCLHMIYGVLCSLFGVNIAYTKVKVHLTNALPLNHPTQKCDKCLTCSSAIQSQIFPILLLYSLTSPSRELLMRICRRLSTNLSAIQDIQNSIQNP
jgi:hypothetical protein